MAADIVLLYILFAHLAFALIVRNLWGIEMGLPKSLAVSAIAEAIVRFALGISAALILSILWPGCLAGQIIWWVSTKESEVV